MNLSRNQVVAVIGLMLIVIFFAGFRYGQARTEPALGSNGIVVQSSESGNGGQSRQEQGQVESDKSQDQLEEEEQVMIVVHITGAVERPGVYKLPQGSRVNDGVVQAGATEEANLDRLNLALVMSDGAKLVVPNNVDEQGVSEANDSYSNDSQAGYYQVAAGQASSAKVNINTASVDELAARLPGIGPVIGQRIVDYRESNGSFQVAGDIVKVSGIGAKTYENIKELITVR